jgi:hypothetical protein
MGKIGEGVICEVISQKGTTCSKEEVKDTQNRLRGKSGRITLPDGCQGLM